MPKVYYAPLSHLPDEPTRMDVLRFFGSADAAAEYFGVGASAVRQWSKTRPIPREHILSMKLENPEFFQPPKSSGAQALL